MKTPIMLFYSFSGFMAPTYHEIYSSCNTQRWCCVCNIKFTSNKNVDGIAADIHF